MDVLSSIADWPFLQEPLYRWMIFLVAIWAMLFAWNGVLSFMQG